VDELALMIPEYGSEYGYDPKTGKAYPPPVMINKEISELIYQSHMWNVASFTQLLQIKNFESKVLKDVSKDMWNEYSENKNQYTMRQATALENESRLVIEQTTQALASLNAAKSYVEHAKDNAISKGNYVLDLEAGTQKQQEIIDSVLPELANYADFKEEVNNMKKTQDKTIQTIEKLIDTNWDQISWKIPDDNGDISINGDIDISKTRLVNQIIGGSPHDAPDSGVGELAPYDAMQTLVPIIYETTSSYSTIIEGHDMIHQGYLEIENNDHVLFQLPVGEWDTGLD
jgi:hypothetical protein